MTRSDSDDGSLYEPEQSPPVVFRTHLSRAARAASSALDFSLDPSASATPSALPTGANTSAAGTPAGSDGGDDAADDSARVSTAEATPDPQPQPAKRSRALNFLKRKEHKTSITIKGVTYHIRDDEILLPDDPRGEAKIDHLGNLQGGRQWKVHTFTSPLRQNPNRVYILSIDAARAAGFRDSLYFFRRNPMIHKLTCNQEEKDRLIELGRLSGNLKSRAVTMVAARNVFKVMGATFLQDGKYVVDDYYEDKSVAAGHKPGEPAFIEPYDPDKDTGTLATSKGNAPPGATSLGLNHLIGHPGKPKVPGAELLPVGGASGYTASFGGTGLQPFGKAWDPAAKKAKPAQHLTWQNWMLEYALHVREENARLGAVRQSNIGQVQVGLDVEEREEDCWEWIEEEYTDDEVVEEERGEGEGEEVKPMLPGPLDSNAPSPLPPPPFGNGLPSLPSALTNHTGSTYPDPAAPSVQQPSFDSTLPALPGRTASHLPSATSSLAGSPAAAAVAAAPSPPPTHPSVVAAAQPRPRKRRMSRVYTPIRGIYDPETNTPHVYRATQPRSVLEFVQVEKRPRLLLLRHDDDGEDNGGSDAQDDDDQQQRRRREAARRVGVASIEIASDPRAWSLDVGDRVGAGTPHTMLERALEARRAQEDLLPGSWDFLDLAQREGLMA